MKQIIALVMAFGLFGCSSGELTRMAQAYSLNTNGAGLGRAEAMAGIKEALSVGVGKVTSQLGSQNGFYKNSAVYIPLPQKLQKVKTVMNTLGLGGLASDVEIKLNRAAEASMPVAKEVFMRSIQQMTLTDAMGILQGNSDAATQYFKQKMTPELQTQLKPIVQGKLAEVGALQAYGALVGKYQNMPFVKALAPDVSGDLTAYVVDKTLSGAFMYLAKEEVAIRTNPAARTTELLRKVFGK